MVKELKNKWKVSGDALGWVVQWKRGGGRPSGLPIGRFLDPYN